MFGIKFIKVQPTTYLLQYRGGSSSRLLSGTRIFSMGVICKSGWAGK